MKSLRWLDRRTAYIAGSLAILLGVMAPAVFPVFASAAALTSRSVTMSSSVAAATGVSYDLQFTAPTAITAGGGLVIDFCMDTPLVGLSCSTTNDVNASGATLGTVKYNGSNAATNGTIDTSIANTTIKWTAGTGYSAGTVVNIPFNNITNPSAVGTFYARVTTYSGSIDYTNPTTGLGTVVDKGGIALSTTNNIAVTAYVQETMTFCVSSTAPDDNCSGADNPSMTLGTGTTVKVLGTTASTGTDYAQVDTNAAHGVVVNLQSDTTGCGGLVRRNEATNCDITPQTTPGALANNSAKFGLKEGPAAATASNDAIGTTPTKSGSYDNTNYFLDYVVGDATGITSTYGSALFSATGPTGQYNMPVTFGAVAAATTPAGIYTANLSMIATGTF